jgi:hypothetical protein
MGLMRRKLLIKRKNDLSIELSDVTNVFSLDTNNLIVRLRESGEKVRRSISILDYIFTILAHYLDLFFKWFDSLDILSYMFPH